MSRWPERKNKIKTALGFFKNTSWQEVNVNFIISTGRTGSKFLAILLDGLSSNIYACHEPDPDLLKVGIKYARGKMSFQKACRIVKRDRLWICNEVNKNRKNVYIESNNRLFSLIPVLWKIFPKAHIVHVVRDGRDYVSSVMNRDHYTYRDKIYYKKKLRLQATDFPDDPYYDKWKDMSQFEKCCWQWVKKDSFIYDAIKDDARAITVKFENIFNEKYGVTTIKKITDFMGLKLDKKSFRNKFYHSIKKKVNRNKKYTFPYYQNWHKKYHKKILDLAGEHMQLYGYNLKEWS